MGKKRKRAEEDAKDKNPRKAPPREQPAAAAADSGRRDAAPLDSSHPREEATASAIGSEQCGHYGRDRGYLGMVLNIVKTCKDTWCDHCRRKTTGRRAASGGKEEAGKRQGKKASAEAEVERSSIFVCLDCSRHFCAGVAAKGKQRGHAQRHAKQEKHWWAAWYNNWDVAYCFQCEKNVSIKMPKKEAAGAMAVADSGHRDTATLDSSNPREEATVSVSGSEQCGHYSCDGGYMKMVLEKIKLSKHARCEHCRCETTGRRAGSGGKEEASKQQGMKASTTEAKVERSSILVCLACCQCFCAGVAAKGKLRGHAQRHAKQEKHWWAVLYNNSDVAYCFQCEKNVSIKMPKGEAAGAMVVDNEAGGHASGSASRQGYVVRGIPNLGNTCYLNALVQCLLVLDKLRIRMLGPDAPSGLLGTVLTELFVETRVANDAGIDVLSPEKLLACIRLVDSRYIGQGMQDSHELLLSLRSGLDKEEKLREPPSMQVGAPSAVAPTVMDSIFGGQMSITVSRKCCSLDSVSHEVFSDLSVPLPSNGPPESVAAPPMHDLRWSTVGKKSCRSPRRIATQLFPATEKCSMEKIETIAEGSDSQIPGSELEHVVMEKAFEPFKLDSTEAGQIWQSKDAVHSLLQTQDDRVLFSEHSGEIVEVPLKSVAFLPHNEFGGKAVEMDGTVADCYNSEDMGLPPVVSSVRENNARMASGSDVERYDNAGLDDMVNKPEVTIEAKEETYTMEVTTEAKEKALSIISVDDGVEDSKSLASVEDCLALYFKASLIPDWHCENCSKVAEPPSMKGSEDDEQMMANTNENATVDGDQTEQPDSKTCQNLDHSAHQVEEDQNEQKDRNGDAIKTCAISNLPPVLTIQLVRFRTDIHGQSYKLPGHVSFKEILDVGPFMDPRSEDKDNSIYRLVGIIEHRGHSTSLAVGHYVAYVRASRIGSHQQHSSDSSSWFCANDIDIKEVPLEVVLKREAYILFYERIEG